MPATTHEPSSHASTARRTIFKSALAMSAVLLAAPLSVNAESDFDITGKYDVLPAPQPTSSGDKIEIVDVFWYGCPHCFKFLPVMERYAASAPEYTEVRRMPAIFRDSWEPHARAFYTAKALGKLEEIHRPIFEAIHNQGAKLATKAELRQFFGKFGVDEQDFEDAWTSFGVDSEVRKTLKAQRLYGVRGTPSVVVNGKYLVSTRKAGSYDNMIKVVEALVRKERES
ncbi:MAG: thiol:disulfide interchange protein DsbA/DsbL [Gammaproteobacteria bacterium]